MNVYLPIAEMSVNIFAILALGGVTGVLSGLLGISGGFLMTPLLIFIGVPPGVSVATVANQMIASSVSGMTAHMRRGNVDFKMGGYIIVGGLAGSTAGVAVFRWLQRSGHLDLTISVAYVTFLGIVGSIMAADSLRALLKVPKKHSEAEKPLLAERLPLRVDFPRSKRRLSILMPLAIGFFVGVMYSLMGSGGFFLIPAMIYLLGMPTGVVIGTSLFQTIFVTANVTFLQAVTTQTVDLLLALLLLTGSVFGAQIGSRLGAKLPAEYLRALLAALVLGIAMKLAFGLFVPPENVYSVGVIND
jgi:uncharacterized membrane protein YfcA